eukprot:s2094_g2.t1
MANLDWSDAAARVLRSIARARRRALVRLGRRDYRLELQEASVLVRSYRGRAALQRRADAALAEAPSSAAAAAMVGLAAILWLCWAFCFLLCFFNAGVTFGGSAAILIWADRILSWPFSLVFFMFAEEGVVIVQQMGLQSQKRPHNCLLESSITGLIPSLINLTARSACPAFSWLCGAARFTVNKY